MNKKIKNYVDVLFADVPASKKAKELKEEMLGNMSERFDDYIAQGKSENQAYSLVVSNLGDVDQILQQVMPGEDFKIEANKYRQRNAKSTAVGVSMYILGAAFLIGMGAYGEFVGNEGGYGVIGLLGLLVLSAIATGLIVYTHMSTPPEYKEYDEDEKRERRLYATPQGKILKNIMGIYWAVITFIYLSVSFTTFAWHTTWIIWVLAGILSRIIELVVELRIDNE